LALSRKSGSQIVVLIDEYDAPVTRNMDNPVVAEANAKILHDFFATLKKDDVSAAILLAVVTGMTRYALTSMDSGGNHLKGISLDPNFAGVRGFTLDEFDPLFGDRLPGTLASLKEAGQMKPEAGLADLRAEILKCHDGYNRGGPTRVLNPYSILNFFDNNRFDRYWIRSGRPAHLTAMIRAKPYDFLPPGLESHIDSDKVRKTEPTGLQAVPVLFHGGYPAQDKVEGVLERNPWTGEEGIVNSYSFRLPNREVSSSCHQDCFEVIF
jgi:hypothetical protein